MLYYPPPRSDELYHFGVMGMRWGRRQYQNPDGSWTELGNARRRVGPGYGHGRQEYIPSRRRPQHSKIEIGRRHISSYQTGRSNRTYNQEDTRTNRSRSSSTESESKAEIHLTDKQKKALTKALVTGVVVAGAVTAAIALRNHGKNSVDRILKSGTKITAQQWEEHMNDRSSFFAAYKPSDKLIYKAFFGGLAEGTGTKAKYTVNATVGKEMRFASKESGRKIYEDLMKNNKEFRNLVKKDLSQSPDVINPATNKQLVKDGGYLRFDKSNVKVPVPKVTKDSSSKLGFKVGVNKVKTPIERKPVILKGYEGFNYHSLAADDDTSKRLREIYTKEAKRRGYSGVVDTNDNQVSLLRSHSPVIVLDKSNLKKNGERLATEVIDDRTHSVTFDEATGKKTYTSLNRQSKLGKNIANVTQTAPASIITGARHVMDSKVGTAATAAGAGATAGAMVYRNNTRTRSEVSERRQARAKSFARSSMTQAQIAKRLGLAESTISKYLSDQNQAVRFREQRQRRSLIRSLYNSGMTQEQIAKRLGISIGTVSAAL